MNSNHYNILMLVIVMIVVLYLIIKLFMDVKNFKNLSENTKFPPWPSKCPDYWQVIDGTKCKNINKIGDCRSSDDNLIMDFGEEIFQGDKGMRYKCNWANKCNTPWEGVDNLC